MSVAAHGPVLDADVAWLRRLPGPSGTLRAALPIGFGAYGVEDLGDDQEATEDALLAVLAPNRVDRLFAGWIDRGPWPPPPGDEHLLYWHWRYRFRVLAAAELEGLPAEGEGSFPDLLFPPDRSWLVSLLWDDSWRSIGGSDALIRMLEQRIPAFIRLDPSTELEATGRVPN